MDLMRALRIIALASAAFCGTAQAGEAWDSLWRNADQRGEQLLQQGDATAAARTYSEPRRKAYAKLQAGDNAAAASDFAAFDDGDGHYNRGNALARGGDLKQALQAYDAALAHDPNNHDAQHNRDLVAKALRDQQQQQQSKKDQDETQSSDKNQAAQDSKPAGSQDTPAQPPPSSASKPHAPELRPPGDSHSSTEKPPDDPSAEQQAGGADPSKTATPPKDEAKKDGAKDPAQDRAKDEAEQAQRDAQDAMQRRSGRVDASADAAQQPMTEQQLAEEQWLRQIPDDPGGLLRRKFMIEHMLRHEQQPEPFNTR
jgi:Ca-activated chloride channel family protein